MPTHPPAVPTAEKGWAQQTQPDHDSMCSHTKHAQTFPATHRLRLGPALRPCCHHTQSRCLRTACPLTPAPLLQVAPQCMTRPSHRLQQSAGPWRPRVLSWLAVQTAQWWQWSREAANSSGGCLLRRGRPDLTAAPAHPRVCHDPYLAATQSTRTLPDLCTWSLYQNLCWTVCGQIQTVRVSGDYHDFSTCHPFSASQWLQQPLMPFQSYCIPRMARQWRM